ncbi:hypothetical protein [Cellulomonas sp. Marseille-Q8402]
MNGFFSGSVTPWIAGSVMLVLFVTSENTKASWGTISEVGASWITQIDHKICNIAPFCPEHPLNYEAQWQSTGAIWMDQINADALCQKIEAACDVLHYPKKRRAENGRYLESLVDVRLS